MTDELLTMNVAENDNAEEISVIKTVGNRSCNCSI